MKTKTMIFVLTAFLLFIKSGITHAEGRKPLTLSESIDIALQHSPLLKTSELDVGAASEALKASKGALFPRVDLSASYLRENRNIPYIQAQSVKIPPKFSDEIYAYAFVLRMPIYEGGRLWGQVKVAELEKTIQSLRRDFTVQDVVANVTNTFNKLLQLKEFRVANLKSVQALERQEKNTELLVKAGRVANVELMRIDVQLASERQNLERTNEAINRTRYGLAYLMGVDMNEVPEVEGSLSTQEKVVADDIEALVKTRPDVVAVSKRVEQAAKRVDVASARRYPSVAVVSNYGQKAGVHFSDRTDVWEAGVLFSINIFDGGIISSDIRREKILHQRVQEELRLALSRARLEVENALSSLREADYRQGVAQKAMVQSEEALRIEELKYKTGAGTVTDVLLAQSAMSSAQANYYQALYDFNAAVTEFRRATGTMEVKR
jgi:outer membrane protein